MMDAGERKAALRGRLVRIDDVVSEILKRHSYPQSVEELLTESMALSTVFWQWIMTASLRCRLKVMLTLKQFLLMLPQGALNLAQIDEDYEGDATLGAPAPLIGLMGSGYLAFTVDGRTGRYQNCAY